PKTRQAGPVRPLPLALARPCTATGCSSANPPIPASSIRATQMPPRSRPQDRQTEVNGSISCTTPIDGTHLSNTMTTTSEQEPHAQTRDPRRDDAADEPE